MAGAPDDIVDTLQRVPLFNELSREELASVASSISRSVFGTGQLVFSEGDPGADLLIVESGSVRIVKTSAGGRHQLIIIERAGSSLGEVSVFDGGGRSTTAITMEPTVLLRLEGARFRELCFRYPAVALKVIRVLGHRLRHARKLVEELSFTTVRGRLIGYLLTLARERGTVGVHGTEVDLSENNEELASRLGTVRELVSRNLGRLHGEGLIVMRRKRVIIPDVARLHKELDV